MTFLRLVELISDGAGLITHVAPFPHTAVDHTRMRTVGFAACYLNGATPGDVGLGGLRHVFEQDLSRLLAHMSRLVLLASLALHTAPNAAFPPVGLGRLKASPRKGDGPDVAWEVLEVLTRNRSIEGGEGQMLLQAELMGVAETLLRAMLA